MAPSFITCACGSSNRTDAKYCNKCGNLLLLKGRYNILSFVASGGFGSIYKGVDTLFSNRLVAVKEMTRNPHQSEKGIQDFKREALMLAGLEHRNLPRIYDHFVDGGRWYLVMDFIEGETLETYMSNTKEGKLPVDKALEISLKLAIVLDYLHSRQPPIIFRDLNPSNIMLTPNKEIYLIDFGISRHFQLGRLYTEKLGRVGFAAPEQYNKAIPVTLLSDIYSLGVTLHHMLTGIDPFNNRPQFFHFAPLKSFDPFISDELDTLVSQMLEVDMNNRPSLDEIKDKLNRIYFFNFPDLMLMPSPQTKASPLPAIHPVQGSQPAIPKQPVHLASPTISPSIGATILTYDHSGEGKWIAWSPDSKYIASAGNGIVQMWEVVSQQNILTSSYPCSEIFSFGWSPDIKFLTVTGIRKGSLEVWDVLGRSEIGVYHLPSYDLRRAAWSPNGKLLVLRCRDNQIRLWDAISGKNIWEQYDSDYSYRGKGSEIAWSPNGRFVASIDYHLSKHSYCTVNLLNATTGKTISVLNFPHSKVDRLSWSPDNIHIAVDESLWNINDDTKNCSYKGGGNITRAVRWSPNGKYIASSRSWDNTVHIWDALTCGRIFISDKQSSEIRDIAWSPDSKYIASVLAGSIWVWQAM